MEATCFTGEEIKKSRFITRWRRPAGWRRQRAFIQQVRDEQLRRGTTVGSFVVGSLDDSQQLGSPTMENRRAPPANNLYPRAADGQRYREVTAVVVRHYGGVVSSNRRLVKAYGNGVQQALKSWRWRKASLKPNISCSATMRSWRWWRTCCSKSQVGFYGGGIRRRRRAAFALPATGGRAVWE